MCDAGLALMGAQSAGTAFGTVGSYYATREKQAALEAEAGVAERNARMSERNARMSEKQAQQALRSGQLKEQQSKLKNASFKSSQKVSLAANGVDLGSDSAVALLTTTDVLGEIESNEIAKDAVNNAWGYRIQGSNELSQASSFRASAMASRSEAGSMNPFLNASSTLLTGAGSVAQSYYSYSKYHRNSEGSKK